MMTMETMVERANQIADHYGLENQMSIAQEECAELIQALSKLRWVGVADPHGTAYIEARSHVSEEMADVLNVLLQLMRLLGNDALVRFWLDMKLDRTLSKMQEAPDGQE